MNWTDGVDLSQTTEIERSRGTLLLGGLCAVLMLIGAVTIVRRGPVETGLMTYLLGGWMGVLFCPAVLVVMGRRLVANGWTSLRLSPDALTWLDFCPDDIPWHAVQDVFVRRTRGGPVVIVRLDPDTAAGLSVSAWQRLARAIGPQAWRQEIHLSNQFDIETEDLADLIRRYAMAHGLNRCGLRPAAVF